jgi:hypothetical protein
MTYLETMRLGVRCSKLYKSVDEGAETYLDTTRPRR